MRASPLVGGMACAAKLTRQTSLPPSGPRYSYGSLALCLSTPAPVELSTDSAKCPWAGQFCPSSGSRPIRRCLHPTCRTPRHGIYSVRTCSMTEATLATFLPSLPSEPISSQPSDYCIVPSQHRLEARRASRRWSLVGHQVAPLWPMNLESVSAYGGIAQAVQ
eukprot:scaffold3664_cov407-Prasinococcus_capsulatus_cf.AAC.15